MNYRHYTGYVIDCEDYHLVHPIVRMEFRATLQDVTHEYKDGRFKKIR